MNPKSLLFGLSAVMVMLIIGAGYGLYWANGQLATRAQEISGLNNEVSKLDEKIENAMRLKASLDENQDLVAIANDILPKQKTQENIIGEVISIQQKYGINELSQISFTEAIDPRRSTPETTQTRPVDGVSGLFEIPFSLSFSTSYENFLNILREFESNRRKFTVEEITISPDLLNDNFVEVTLNLTSFVSS